jgi:ABC-type sulfate transport system permease component
MSPVCQKTMTIISIMLQSINQKCNALQSVFGFFLHSCNTPQKVVQALARMGVSISVDSINKGIQSLSKETCSAIRSMGQTLLVAYAYDNFDIDFKTDLPTVEK